ncbi:MAG: hypothetical protein GW949_05030 [Spirochaetales bacterium]|nr:hypothetical protein [Spirochaetales bacterium]
MKIRENPTQNLTLTDTPWWGLVVGLIIAGFSFVMEPVSMTEIPGVNKFIVIFGGLFLLGLFSLAMRKTKIHFDRPAGTITRKTEPLLPVGSILLFRPRSETRPIEPILFAYLERQRSQNVNAKPTYSLALATGVIPDEILHGESSFIFSPDIDKQRWLVGFNHGMKKNNADEIIGVVNQWLGTTTPSSP